MNAAVLIITVLGIAGLIFALEHRYGPRLAWNPVGEALYLVSRVATRHGFQMREKPLSLIVPRGSATLHYHLLGSSRERDSIILKAVHSGPSRLGHVVVDNDPARMVAAGLKRLPLGVPALDRRFRLFAAPEQHVVIDNLVSLNGELARLLHDLSCRSRRGHFELVDLGGVVKIRYQDRIRFPSDVEKITLDLVRLHELYEEMAGPRPPVSPQESYEAA